MKHYLTRAQMRELADFGGWTRASPIAKMPSAKQDNDISGYENEKVIITI